ncbi:MAG: S8 family peptidase [Bacteroidota bacterium]
MRQLFSYIFILSFFLFSAQERVSYRLFQAIESNSTVKFDVIFKFHGSIDYQALKDQFKSANTLPEDRVKPVILEAQELNNHYVNYLGDLFTEIEVEEMNFRPLWIANAACAHLTISQINILKEQDFIAFIDLNETGILKIEKPISSGNGSKTIDGHEPGHDIINAPAMWALGYTGQGRKLLTYDTGFWPNHPAIASRYLGNFFPQDQCWFPYDLPSPGDKGNSHGTHVTGTVLGLEISNNDTIGVAPGAYFIATDPIVTDLADVRTFEELAMGFEWALNPDNDLNTTYDIPDVINNSWGRPVDADVEACNQIMIDVFNLVEAAGIANVFSAGNSGPDPMTISAPHNINTGLVNSFTVGALNMDANLTIASFSSRGPSFCPESGSLLIKPEVSAPGVNVRSAVGQNEYDNYNGTSMAAPHVSGAVLLLKEAFPYLGGEDILLALYNSAIDLGDNGEDNTYGNGVIDVFEAYNYLIDQGNDPVPPVNSSFDIAISDLLAPNQGVRCSSTFSPSLEVTNLGDETINGIEVEFTFLSTGDSEIFESPISILPGETGTAELNNFETSVEGDYEFIAIVRPLESIIESDTINNRAVYRGNVRPEGQIPFFEDFEDGISSSNWFNYNDDGLITWDTVSTNGLQWSDKSAWMNFYDYNPRLNQKDELQSRYFDLSTTAESDLYLEFDYAYRRRGNASVLKDTLYIFARNNCEAEWDLIWEAHSDSLKTVEDNSTQAFFPDSSNHWNMRVFDLSSYIGAEKFQFKISTSNRNGNNLFIDNVRLYFGSTPVAINEVDIDGVYIFPNPSKELLLVENSGDLTIESLALYSLEGQLIEGYRPNKSKRLSIDISHLSTGVYICSIKTSSGVITKKIIKE